MDEGWKTRMTHGPFNTGRYGFTRMRAVRLKRWQLVLAFAVAAALMLTLAVVAVSAFLLIFPAVLVGGLIWRFLAYWRGESASRAGRSGGDQVIDAEYVILSHRERGEPSARDADRDGR